jgi:monofunctional biosynthetic peptidoglycan transglycosylase
LTGQGLGGVQWNLGKVERRGLIRKLIRWVFYGTGAACLLLACAVLADSFGPPVSTLMLARWLKGEPVQRHYVRLSAIAPAAVAAVISSEDQRFCRHHGVDWSALSVVMSEAGEEGPSRGASTITMQTAKNLFLWPSRSALRKGIEIVIALGLDQVWTKHRVLEVYLNIAEWGDGIFGIEGAAQHYFHKSAAALNAREAALLATALPNPALRNPARPGAMQRRLSLRLMRRASDIEPWLDCLK